MFRTLSFATLLLALVATAVTHADEKKAKVASYKMKILVSGMT